jgi:hypothetical protein
MRDKVDAHAVFSAKFEAQGAVEVPVSSAFLLTVDFRS